MLSRHSISKLKAVDWDFAGTYSDSPFSAIHWHPGRLAAQLATALVGLLSNPGDLVVDPFVGSGTVVVEAQRLGRRSIGVDLNPVACNLARAKTISKSAAIVGRAIDGLLEDADTGLLASRQVSIVTMPPSVQEKWYTAAVRRDLRRLWAAVDQADGIGKTLAEAAFSAILLPVCRETRHWGYVCDNSTPTGDHAGDPVAEYRATLERFRRAYEQRDAEIRARQGRIGPIESATIFSGDARRALDRLSPGSVDLVVTSPPYFGVSDYAKAQRLSYEWFGVEIEPVRLQEIGARSKRHRLAAVEQYIHELGEVFASVRRCLSAKGACVVVIGESATRESVLGKVIRVSEAAGLRLELDLNRTVSSQRRQAPSIKGEHLLAFSRS